MSFQVIVKIEKIGERVQGTKQITIDCRNDTHAEAVCKVLTSCAEQEKQIALERAGDNTNV